MPFASSKPARMAAAVPRGAREARGCARRRRCGGGRRPRPRRSGSARPPRAAGAPTPPRRRARSGRGRTRRPASSAARRSVRFAPQTSSASRSSGPRSSVVTGSGSRPQACRFVPSSRARIGPPNASCSGFARGGGEHRGEPARATRRRRRRGSRAGRRAAASTAALRATLSPRGAPERDVAGAVGSRRAARSRDRRAPSSTTTISASCAAAWPATDASATARYARRSRVGNRIEAAGATAPSRLGGS